MIFKIHYFCLSSGSNAFTTLLGVFIQTYTDASPIEIGFLYMLMPLTNIIARPFICAMADRNQAYKRYTILCQLVVMVGYLPFIIIPYLGPEFYNQHSRMCWYIFCGLKVAADVATGGINSIADSLAINYAKRVDTDFCVYRIWGAIAWMSFGIITGNINELPFMPRYVPAFIVLLTSCFVDVTAIWLWPDDYFRMVSPSEIEASRLKREAIKSQDDATKDESSFLSKHSKCLMPRDQVIAHAKSKIKGLFTFSWCCNTKSASKNLSETPVPALEEGSANKRNNVKNCEPSKTSSKDNSFSKGTQLRILATLARRDPRLLLYSLFFISTGIVLAAYSFFYISLAEICNDADNCNFSRLAGFLQVSVAGTEAIIFMVIKRVMSTLGRVKSCALCLFLISFKYITYGMLWYSVDPHYALLLETVQGTIFALNLTLMVELGHYFSTQVRHIVPELLERNIISQDQVETVKTSLSATMQGLTSCSSDGIGRCIGCLIYGVLFTYMRADKVWFLLGISASIAFGIALITDLLDKTLNLNIGLNSKEDQEQPEVDTLAPKRLEPKLSFSLSIHSYS